MTIYLELKSLEIPISEEKARAIIEKERAPNNLGWTFWCAARDNRQDICKLLIDNQLIPPYFFELAYRTATHQQQWRGDNQDNTALINLLKTKFNSQKTLYAREEIRLKDSLDISQKKFVPKLEKGIELANTLGLIPQSHEFDLKGFCNGLGLLHLLDEDNMSNRLQEIVSWDGEMFAPDTVQTKARKSNQGKENTTKEWDDQALSKSTATLTAHQFTPTYQLMMLCQHPRVVIPREVITESEMKQETAHSSSNIIQMSPPINQGDWDKISALFKAPNDPQLEKFGQFNFTFDAYHPQECVDALKLAIKYGTEISFSSDDHVVTFKVKRNESNNLEIKYVNANDNKGYPLRIDGKTDEACLAFLAVEIINGLFNANVCFDQSGQYSARIFPGNINIYTKTDRPLAEKSKHLVRQEIRELQKSILQARQEEKRTIDKDESNHFGFTAINFAVYTGDKERFKDLFKAGADCEKTTQEGFTPLHHAVNGGHLDIIEDLLEKNSTLRYTPTYAGHTGLHLAVIAGHLDIIDALEKKDPGFIELINSSSNSPLLPLACRYGHINTVLYLIEKEVDVYATMKGWMAIHVASKYGHVKIVEVLLKIGTALINATTDDGLSLSPLYLAIEYCCDDVVLTLLANDADIKLKTQGKTPLVFAENLALNNANYNHIVKLIKFKEKGGSYSSSLSACIDTLNLAKLAALLKSYDEGFSPFKSADSKLLSADLQSLIANKEDTPSLRFKILFEIDEFSSLKINQGKENTRLLTLLSRKTFFNQPEFRQKTTPSIPPLIFSERANSSEHLSDTRSKKRTIFKV